MQAGHTRKSSAAGFLRALICLVVLLTASAGLRADTIFLKNGKRIIAEAVTETGDKVYYENEFGRVSIPKSMVDRIEKGGPVPVRRTPSPPKGVEPEREGADLPPTGIRLTLDARMVDEILKNGVVDEAYLADLAGKSHQGELDRQNSVNAYLMAAIHEARSNRVAEASGWAEKALFTDGFDRNALLLATQLDLTRRKYSEALQHILVAYGQQPDSPDVLTLLGDAYYFSEGAERAVWYWKQANNLRPDAKLSDRIERAEKEAAVERDLQQVYSYHFVLSWQGPQSRDSIGKEVLEGLEEIFQELEVALDFSPRETIAVILYGSEQFSDITRAPAWAGAVNDGKIRIPVQGLNGLSPDLIRVLRHELVHSFIHQITEGRCPTWFNEGMAQYHAKEPLDDFGQILARRYARSQHIPLEMLEGSFRRLNSSGAFLAYGESLAAVQMIAERHGAYQLPYILRAIRRGETLEKALQSVLRLSYRDLDEEVASYLSKFYGTE